MTRTTVTSSNITSIGYESENRILEIEFRGGRVYQYSEVPQSVYLSLMAAESHGRFFWLHVRFNYFTRQLL
jgi:hypothetical protein